MLNWRDPRNPKSGGAERVSKAYLSALQQRGHEVYWFANAFPGCARAEVVDGLQIVRGGGSGTSVVMAIQWYRQQAPFDLVIDQHHGIPWYAPWWSKTNCVAYIHEVLGPIWKAFYPWPWSTIGQSQERWTHWLYRNVPFWTPSESTKAALLEHGVREVVVIPNGTDATPLSKLEDKALAQPIGLVAVSRLAPNKRVEHAIEATKVLLSRGVKVRLTVVGTGEAERGLRELAGRLGLGESVLFTGQTSEEQKNQYLRQAHFLVHTSIREGWGLNVIEANAMGTPAIVYPVGGLVDSTVNGETGVVTQAETPEALADAVMEVAGKNGTYARLRINAWERSKAFEWKQVLPQACDWLESIASRRR